MNCLNYITNNNIYVRIQNNGAYTAQFYLSYLFKGRTVTLDSGLFNTETCKLDIPHGASNPHLKVLAKVFRNVVTVYDSSISSILPSCFIMKGRILKPSIKQVPCSGLEIVPPNQCCCKCCNESLENVGGLYVSISNESHVNISFIVQYRVDVRTFTKQSPIFGPGKKELVRFSVLAENICFNVIDNSVEPPDLIFNVTLLQCKKHCYKLTQAQNIFHLIQVKC